MSTMHPHWQTTDEDEVPVRITETSPEAASNRPTINVPRASRTPAAFIGIALFLGIGFAAFRGVGSFIGQLMEEDGILVTITSEGIDPPLLTARRGEKITWVNSDTIPHILASETIPTDGDKPFLSTAIQPTGRFSYIVPVDAEGKTHDYISRTSADISGQIIIDPTTPPVAATSSAASSAAFVPAAVASSSALSSARSAYPDSVFPPAVIPSGMAVSSVSSALWTAGNTVADNGIPQNPYTIGNSTVIPPVRGNPVTTTAAVTQHRPSAQPATGMGAWVIGIIAFASFWIVTRKALAK